MISTSVLRAKRLIAERGPAVATMLVLVGACALGAGVWLHQNPTTTQVTDYTDQQTVSAETVTTATATGATGLYDEGETLRNQPVYLSAESPEVTVTLRTSRAAGDPIRVEQRLVLVTTAARDGAVFWSENRTLARTQTDSRTVTTQSTLNVSALQQRLADRERAIGSAGDLSMALLVRIHYDTGEYSGTLTERVPIDLTESWYRIPTVTLSTEHQRPITRTATVPRDRWVYLLPGAVGALALLAGVVTAGAWFTRLRDGEEGLTRQIQHRTHAEWISEGSLAGHDLDGAISMASLEDLVDVAIDTDSRVVYDPERELYAVVDDPTVYVYRPTSGWEWQDEPVG